MEQNGIQVMREEDRISLLPDCLLVDIISRLPDTITGIRTCILSKRWQRLWTSLPNLTFFDNAPITSRFFSFVDKTLAQCSSQLSLNSFRLCTTPCTEFKSKINDWILYTTNRNVQELELLFLARFYRFEIDQFFFTNSCFTHLKLKYCSLNPTGDISWNKLKSLYIHHTELDDDLIQNILFGSPLLETLELNSCCGPLSRIDITSRSVKNLVFLAYSGDGAWIMKINAPHIQSLTIQSYVWFDKFLLHDVSSLLKAKIDYEEAYCKTIAEEDAEEEMLKGFLLSLRHVKELKIGKRCLQVLSRLEAKGFVFPPGLRLQDDSDSGETD